MRETLQELVLQELAWYRVLTLKQILTLTGYRNEHHARDQLNSLRDKEYVYLKTPYMSRGRLPGVYQLLPKGKQYLLHSGIAVPYPVPSLDRLRNSGTMGLQHTLRVNDVFILLQLLTVQYPERFQLIKRIHEREMSRYLGKTDGGVEPDGFFQLNKQGVLLEYERTSAYADMEKYQEKIRSYLLLFENASKLDLRFGVKTPSLMTVVDRPDRVPILTTYCARVLRQFRKTDWESRFLFSSFDGTLTPLQFFCAERWSRAWLPIPPPVAYFPDHADLLQAAFP